MKKPFIEYRDCCEKVWVKMAFSPAGTGKRQFFVSQLSIAFCATPTSFSNFMDPARRVISVLRARCHFMNFTRLLR
jgi:hypothetical protein